MLVELRNGDASVSIDTARGGRLSSLQIHNREILVMPDVNESPLMWGCYPMAPYAGRVRSGIVHFKNFEHELPLALPPHGGHGTVYDQSWEITRVDSSSTELRTSFGKEWPFGGFVTHRIDLHHDHIHLELCVTAETNEMPAQVGWHPWFRKPSRTSLKFGSMLKRDAEGIATSQLIHANAENVDDCFIDPIEELSLTVNEVELSLSSDCSHWVVYDLSANAICVEPQSGAPNQINDSPFILSPHQTLSRWFDIAWTGRLNQH